MTSRSAALVVQARGIAKVFGEGALAFQALKGVDLDVREGELLMLAGPSGSGKTTLLSILGCVLSPSSGELALFGEDVTKLPAKLLPALRLQRIGFVFQGANLIASLSARDNVALVMRLRGLSARNAKDRASEMLERVGLGGKLASLPAQLSGGERQRVGIARALVGDPPLVLADEPTAALDASSGLLVTELLKELCRERGRTIVVVTHDNRIFHLADRIIHLEDGLLADARMEKAS